MAALVEKISALEAELSLMRAHLHLESSFTEALLRSDQPITGSLRTEWQTVLRKTSPGHSSFVDRSALNKMHVSRYISDKVSTAAANAPKSILGCNHPSYSGLTEPSTIVAAPPSYMYEQSDHIEGIIR